MKISVSFYEFNKPITEQNGRRAEHRTPQRKQACNVLSSCNTLVYLYKENLEKIKMCAK